MKYFFFVIFVTSAISLCAQSFTPASFNRKKPGSDYKEGFRSIKVNFKDSTLVSDTTYLKSGEGEFVIRQKWEYFDNTTTEYKEQKGIWKKEWFLPFRESSDALLEAMTSDNAKLKGPSSISIRPSIDSSKSSAVYADLFTIIADNYCRVALGTNITQAQTEDSLTTPKEIGFQKLTNGGGNIILNLYRPVLFKNFTKCDTCVPSKYFLTAVDFNGFADIERFNQAVYNPGFGCLMNVSFDYRFITRFMDDSNNSGNLFRMGINGRYQYNIVNQKYKATNDIEGIFNNLSIGSIGMYIGVAMFNFQLSYNIYSKSDPFFDDKTWLLRIELIPMQL